MVLVTEYPLPLSAPSAPPKSITVDTGSSGFTNISWLPIPIENQGGILMYEVLIQYNGCGGSKDHECQWCPQEEAIVRRTSMVSLPVKLRNGTKYQVKVRGVTGNGILYGPFSDPFCFSTPEGGVCVQVCLCVFKCIYVCLCNYYIRILVYSQDFSFWGDF